MKLSDVSGLNNICHKSLDEDLQNFDVAKWVLKKKVAISTSIKIQCDSPSIMSSLFEKKWSAWNTCVILLMFIDTSWDLKSVSGLNIRSTAVTLTAEFPSSACFKWPKFPIVQHNHGVASLGNLGFSDAINASNLKKIREVVFYLIIYFFETISLPYLQSVVLLKNLFRKQLF